MKRLARFAAECVDHLGVLAVGMTIGSSTATTIGVDPYQGLMVLVVAAAVSLGVWVLMRRDEL